MALWQFTIRIVPKKTFIETQGSIPSKVSYEEFIDLPTWEINKYEAQLSHLLSNYFSKDESQAEFRTSWGKSDETTFLLSRDENNIGDLTVRLDLRSLTQDLLKVVEEVGNLLDAVLVTELGSVIDPKIKIILEEMKASKAFRFVSDPRGFFDT